MAYNSAYTGPQVDAAVGAVRNKETIWDAKQNALSGTEDQIVGFNSAGEAVAVEAPDSLPSGGTTGQMLYKSDSGSEWGDKPVMQVFVTTDGDGYKSDKTFSEIMDAMESGSLVYAVFIGNIIPLSTTSSLVVVFYIASFYNGTNTEISIRIKNDDSVSVEVSKIAVKASGTTFFPGATGLTADNVQEAIEEVNAKIPVVTATTAILGANSWHTGSPGDPATPPIEGEPGWQIVQVPGVLADSTAQAVDISPATQEDAEYWSEYGVWCTAQGAGTLTFTCKSTPGGANPGETPGHGITLNIKLTPLSGA